MKIKKVIDVDLEELDKMSRALGKQIQAEGFVPDHVLYVERAGLLIGDVLAGFFNVGLSGIMCRRSGTSAKSGFKTILRRLPRWLTHTLRRLEISSSIHNVKSKRHVFLEHSRNLKGKRILLVDDAVDTGHSLNAILYFLSEYGCRPEDIKIAVLTTTGVNPVTAPDFTLLENTICAFPWSYDGPEFYQARLKMAWLRRRMNNRIIPEPVVTNVAAGGYPEMNLS